MATGRLMLPPLALAVCGYALAVAAAAEQPPPQGVFRSRVTMVPIDVRVLDQDGKPVTDLKPEEFSVTEDGVAQAIRHFSTQSLSAGEPAAGAAPRALRNPSAAEPAPQTNRVFLVVLGKGRLNGPARELPALTSFLSTRLLPQDQVAIMAYNRATAFTTDRARLRRVVERFAERNAKIEQMLDDWFSGLRAVYGSKGMPPHIQAEIDAVFRDAPPGGPDALKLAEARRRADDDLRAARRDPALDEGFAFDEYVRQQFAIGYDLANLYTGIDYLRRFDGDKHIVFVAPGVFYVPNRDHDRNILRAAGDARVALDIISTSGVAGAPKPYFTGSESGPLIAMSAVPENSAVFGQMWAAQDMREAAELTGGQATVFRYADVAFDRIDTATRFQYLLGYSPADAVADGRLRRVAVKVTRPGVTLQYRRGYYANEEHLALARREFRTVTRVEAAARYWRDVTDIQVKMAAPVVTGSSMTIQVAVKSPRTVFAEEDGRHVAVLDVAVYCVGSPPAGAVGSRPGPPPVVCESQQQIDLRLGDESFRAFQKEGATYTLTVPVKAEPTAVKVIVYDYAADVLGSTDRKVK